MLAAVDFKAVKKPLDLKHANPYNPRLALWLDLSNA